MVGLARDKARERLDLGHRAVQQHVPVVARVSCDALRMTHQGFVGGDGKGDGRRDLP